MSDSDGPLGVVYLLHFERPYKHAQHYVGFCERLAGVDTRIEYHANGRGSRLMAVVSQAGIGFDIVRLWRGTRSDERRLHNAQSRAYCPVCSDQPRKRRDLEEIEL